MGRGQLNVLLPKAGLLREIVHIADHGTKGHSFDYSAKQQEITVYYPTEPETNNVF